jgi:uncharacterized protein YggE
MAPYLEVTGSGAATAPPDRLDLYVGVTLVRTEVGAALADLGDRVRALGTALRGAGVEELSTTSSAVGDEWVDGKPSGYRATQDLRLRLSDPTAVGEVLSAAVAAVGDDFRMGNLSWAVADENALAARAREAAFEDARAKAEQLATLSGGTLGKLRRVTEGQGYGGPVVRLAAVKQDAGFAAEPGECRVEVSLTVRWALAR